MPVVTETLVLPGGDPPPTTTAIIQLAGVDGHPFPMGYGTAPDATTVGTYQAVTVPEDPDADPVDATWSVDLLANSTLIPTGTVWMVTLSGPGIDSTPRYFIVPEGGGPYDLLDLLTDAPASIAPTELAALAASLGSAAFEDASEFLVVGGALVSITEGDHVTVDDTDPTHPIVGVDGTAFATAAQGATADNAVQPADLAVEEARALAAEALLIPLAEKGAAGGVAPLGVDGKVGTSFLPPLAINETFTAASQAAMLALDAQRGDMAVRTDLDPDGFFLLVSDSPATLADWKQILAPGAVVTVDGRSGAVVLSDLYDATGAAAAAQAFAIQRDNHSGNQAIATVTGLQTALDGKQTADTNLTTLATPGAAKQTVRVNAAGTDYEFVEPRSCIVAQSYVSASIDTSTAETTLITAAVPTDLVAGDSLRLTAEGDLNNNTAGAVNFTPRWKLGATTFLSRAAQSQANNANLAAWKFTVDIDIVDPASAQRASIIGLQSGALSSATVAATAAGPMGVVGRSSGLAENLTTAKNLTFTIEMGTAHASAAFTVKSWKLEVIRQR